jgi:uncharacterized GH25 family protein
MLLAIALLTLPPTAAAAHEFWLCPSRYRAAAGDTVGIGVLVGTGFRGEAKPYAATRAVKFTLAARTPVDLTPAAMNGGMRWASFVLPDEQGAMVAYQSNFAKVELPAREFDDYLRLEGLEAPLEARRKLGIGAGPGRERYARCPKTWIAGRRDAGGAVRAQRPAGLPLEIVPVSDPGGPNPLDVRVLWQGRPLAGALVRAWRRPLARGWAPVPEAARDSVGMKLQVRTDARGEARLALEGDGEWLVATVHMIPCRDRREADWESWWASLTFARGVAGR